MEVQKLANLDQMIQQWELEVKTYLLKVLPRQAAVGLPLVMTMMYFLSSYIGSVIELHWSLSALIIWVCLQIPLIMTGIPRKPTQADVDDNRALRRAFGMDDTVNK